MESKVKLLGHPVHPMLVVFPVALFSTAVAFDLLGLVVENTGFATVSFWALTVGLIVGIGAALFGLIDWLAIRSETRAKRVGLWHGLGNGVLVILFALSWWLRLQEPGNAPGGVAIVLGLLGAGIALVTAWLGGELVYRLRIGVDDDANADAPSSLGGERTPRPPEVVRDPGRPARVT